jgi:IAP75 family protein translocase
MSTGSDKFDNTHKSKKPKNKDNFICESVLATNLPTGPGIPTKSELFQGLNARKGVELSKKDLSDDLEQLLNTGLFANVDANVTPQKEGYAVEFVFREKIWPQLQSFRVSGSTVLPKEIEQEVLRAAQKNQNCTVRVLATAKNIIEGYYTSKGLTFGTISHFDGMENGEVIAHIVEGEITRVQTVFVDESLQPLPGNKGATHPRVIQREHNFKVGNLYNVEDAKTALRDIFLLQLFDNVQVVPKADERDPTKIQVDILLRERPTKTAETELEWSIAPGEDGRPDLVSVRPGGSVFFEHRNLDRWGRQLFGSISTANFLQPQEDLGFKLEYIHPYYKGDTDTDKTSLKAAAFNSRKLSPVFTGGPLLQEVPGVWVDRAGFKATLCQHFTRQSRCSLGAVLEEVTTRDDSGAFCATGAKQMPNGALTLDGPKTTISETGTDRVMFLQCNFTRDTTRFVNGTQVGARDIYQVDQSIPFGIMSPMFNRSKLELTRFMQILSENQKSSSPPPVIVLHVRSGHILGNCAAYDAFALGGPHSCRGYTVGELGVARSFLETALELRIPLPVLKTHAFCFLESCNDLGSSASVSGNPTEYYRRAGQGSTHGVGIKLGPIRAEWCIDGNSGMGSSFIRFGERF